MNTMARCALLSCVCLAVTGAVQADTLPKKPAAKTNPLPVKPVAPRPVAPRPLPALPVTANPVPVRPLPVKPVSISRAPVPAVVHAPVISAQPTIKAQPVAISHTVAVTAQPSRVTAQPVAIARPTVPAARPTVGTARPVAQTQPTAAAQPGQIQHAQGGVFRGTAPVTNGQTQAPGAAVPIGGHATAPKAPSKPQAGKKLGWKWRVAAGNRVSSQTISRALAAHAKLSAGSLARTSRFVIVAKPASAKHPHGSTIYSAYCRLRHQFIGRVAVHPRPGKMVVSANGHLRAMQKLTAFLDSEISADTPPDDANPELPTPGADIGVVPADNETDTNVTIVEDPGEGGEGNTVITDPGPTPPVEIATTPIETTPPPIDPPPVEPVPVETTPQTIETPQVANPGGGVDVEPGTTGGNAPGTPTTPPAGQPIIPPAAVTPGGAGQALPIPAGGLQPEAAAGTQFAIRLNDPVGPRRSNVALIATVLDRTTGLPAANAAVTLRISWPGKPVLANTRSRVYIRLNLRADARGKVTYTWNIPASAAVYYPFLHVSTADGASAMTRIRIGGK